MGPQMNDCEDDMQKKLAERARAGDREAFGELVSLHRAKAFGIARRIVRDPSAAEDAVQEALLQAFLHINRLADVERFVPWLSRIVRNQALMKMRSASRASRETSFTGVSSHAGAGPDSDRIDLDSLLYRMTRAQRADDGTADPENALMRREFYSAVHGMMHGLSARERAIFEAHFFNQLGPQEIAALFGTTEGNVYKSLSRSRAKVKEERVRVYLRDRLDDTDARQRQAKVLLPIRTSGEVWSFAKTSVCVCWYLMLRYAGIPGLDISEVMGLTGQAFRLCVEKSRIDASGPTSYYWEPVFEEGLNRLGFRMRNIGDGGIAPSAYMLGEAAAFARTTIAGGMPVAVWDMFSPEFGLMYGYEDDRQLFTGDDGRGPRTLTYDRLGRGTAGGLFVMAVERLKDTPDPQSTAVELIASITKHAYGERTFPGYVTGLGAYDAWRQSFRDGSTDPLGNAYTLAIAADAREHAVRFLRRWSSQWEGERAKLAFKAEGHYYEAACCLARLAALFPFPHGGNPHDRSAAREAESLLAEARNQEEAGVETLGRLARHISN
ncbi:sigma-70 family RNA polymerase sigma factor [Paenibacillus mesophilus]|uniref:RNA polymerase sigma factor n=1 Tax=Paenibacillus mesophilus TaxID=2582849 RepID=UPI00110DAD7A|nr:sigma-70 family RNA polymerase sigma factor [Paenibacillus mesophilus]TMV48900.1 sigma-70 family RNA polymerase sigma factor [Paenibacillus mesophilus]